MEHKNDTNPMDKQSGHTPGEGAPGTRAVQETTGTAPGIRTGQETARHSRRMKRGEVRPGSAWALVTGAGSGIVRPAAGGAGLPAGDRRQQRRAARSRGRRDTPCGGGERFRILSRSPGHADGPRAGRGSTGVARPDSGRRDRNRRGDKQRGHLLVLRHPDDARRAYRTHHPAARPDRLAALPPLCRRHGPPRGAGVHSQHVLLLVVDAVSGAGFVQRV